MSISNGNAGDNGAGIYQEGASPGRVSGEQQPPLGCQQNTARRPWNKEVNRIVMTCYIKSNITKRGYRKRMYNYWKEIGIFETSEQIAVQVRAIKTNKCPSDLETGEIKRNIDCNVKIQEGNERVELSKENSVHRHNIDKQRNMEGGNTNDMERKYNEDDVTDLNNADFVATAEQM